MVHKEWLSNEGRGAIIEQRKMETEKMQREVEQLLKSYNEAKEKEVADEEKRRLEEEKQRRQAELDAKALRDKEREVKKSIVAQITGETVADDDERLNQDVAALRRTQVEEKDKQRQLFEKKMLSISKKLEHTVRARREEETPLLRAEFEASVEEQRRAYEILTAEKERAHFALHKERLALKATLERVVSEKVLVRKGGG